MTYSIANITSLIGAHRYGNAEADIDWLLTDSRSLVFPEESLFFAIRTQKNDGHRYIDGLYRRGVHNFVVDHLPAQLASDANYLLVPSPLSALQRLAERHREAFDCPVIGITGSNGKTIVKEWLFQLLSPDYVVTRSPRSWNSQIGVPLSVWRLHSQTQVGIFEAGISESGEMQALTDIIQPTIGIMTHLGAAHDENFGSRQEKCREKLRLFHNTQALIYNADDEMLCQCIADSGYSGQLIAWHTAELDVPFLDAASREDAGHCIALCRYLGMPEEVIRERIAALQPVAMRLEVKEGINDCSIITDTCNSDLGSLEIALDFMRRRPENASRRRTLILSDIQQTGLTLTELYTQVASLANAYGVEQLIGIGQEVSAGIANVNADIIGIDDIQLFPSVDAFLAADTFAHLRHRVILIKGARQACFDRIAEALVAKVHETILEVNLSALVGNLNFYRSLMQPTTKMVCMVKASAYGAGAVEVARTLQDHQVDYLAVAVADEGVELRRAGITANIIVMNPEMSSFHTLFDYHLEPEVYSFRLLDALANEARHQGITAFPVHLKIDTGMHRLGFDPCQDIDVLIHRLKSQQALIPRSVFSHFVGSDSDDFNAFSERQWELFANAADRLQEAFPHHILRHICNSAAIQHFPERHGDMVRLGLGLYGLQPMDAPLTHRLTQHPDRTAEANLPASSNSCLNVVSTLKTTILQIHDVPAGDTVGYSRRGVLQRDSRIAALPIGYADGLNRHLGCGHGYCIVSGQRAPYVGNICMDVCMIDVTDIDCHEGDTAIIFGPELSPSTLADAIDTIPYEILTSVSPRVKRIYFCE